MTIPTMPPGKRFSICIPSRRNDMESYASISSAISYARKTGAEVVVSDNSGDSEKRTRLQNLDIPELTYLFSNADNTWGNWYNAISHSTGDYIGILSDDDILFKTVGGFNFDRIPEDNLIGYRPHILVCEPHTGTKLITKFSIESDSAADRMSEYFKKFTWGNNSLFSFFRRDIWLDIAHLILKYHPTKGGYFDWAIVLAALSSGKLYDDGSSVLVYNNGNWADGPAAARDYIYEGFIECGLEKVKNVAYVSLLNALDSFILIMRKNNPTPFPERKNAAIRAFKIYLDSFLVGYKKTNNKQLYLGGQESIEKMLQPNLNLTQALNYSLQSLVAIEPLLKEPYFNFYQQAIGTPWGALPQGN